jgi:hypothetical protein
MWMVRLLDTSLCVAKRANPFAVKALDDQGAGPISDIISGLNVISQRVASLSGNSTGGNGTTTTDPVKVIDIPQPRSRLGKRVMANVNNFTLLNQPPYFPQQYRFRHFPDWE